MPTEELKQALLRQKTGDVEKDVLEVISRSLGFEYGVVARVAYALRYTNYVLGVRFDDEDDVLPVEKSIENRDVREAIAKAMDVGVRRLYTARAITNGRSMTISPRALVPLEKASELCRGCPESLDCAANKISTPEACWRDRLSSLVVFPLQMNDDLVEVEAQQPRGKHVIHLNVINPPRH